MGLLLHTSCYGYVIEIHPEMGTRLLALFIYFFFFDDFFLFFDKFSIYFILLQPHYVLIFYFINCACNNTCVVASAANLSCIHGQGML